MKNESLTMYIPLLGKARMSRDGIFPDEMAERIVASVDYNFQKVDGSRKLAVYMAMRAAQYDRLARDFSSEHPDGVILQLGCGLDSRCLRVKTPLPWYDLDLPEVIALRRTYFAPSEGYRMLAAPAVPTDWLEEIPHTGPALVMAEGLSMYLSESDMRTLIAALQRKFSACEFIFDAYTTLGAKLSRVKNPINAVKAKIDFAMDDASLLLGPNMKVLPVCDMVTEDLLLRLPEWERSRFRLMGRAGRRLYRMYGYRLTKM